MPPGRAARAFTLLEVAIALAILLVVVAIGWSNLQPTLPRFRMVQAAKGLYADVMKLRNTAIRTNRETRLRLVSSPGDCRADRGLWGGSWELAIGNRAHGSTSWELLPPDAAEDGSDDDTSEGRVDIGEGGNRQARWICLQEWGTIEGPGTGNEDSVVFSPRGWVENPGSDFGSEGTIDIVLVNQVAGQEGVQDEIHVRIARSGLVRLDATLSGGDALTAATTEASSR